MVILEPRIDTEDFNMDNLFDLETGSRCKVKRLGLSENNFSGVEASLMEIFHKVEEVELENTSLTIQQLAVILSYLAVSSKTKKLNLNQNCPMIHIQYKEFNLSIPF